MKSYLNSHIFNGFEVNSYRFLSKYNVELSSFESILILMRTLILQVWHFINTGLFPSFQSTVHLKTILTRRRCGGGGGFTEKISKIYATQQTEGRQARGKRWMSLLLETRIFIEKSSLDLIGLVQHSSLTVITVNRWSLMWILS